MTTAIATRTVTERRYFGGRWYSVSTTHVRGSLYRARISGLAVGIPGESPYAPGSTAPWYYSRWSHNTQYSRTRCQFTQYFTGTEW